MRENARAIIIATWVGIIINLFLTIAKAIGGVISGSKALIADALHSASDIVGSIVILFAVKIANKPPDAEHPYGHGKAENIASIIVALLLIVIGIEISITSVKVFFGEQPIAPGKLALFILAGSIIIKEALFHYKYRLGKKYRSAALVSEAWHHRSDSFSSLAALIGVVLSIIGDKFNLPFLIYSDAVAGIIVSIIVIKVGYDLMKESANVVLEQVLDKEETKEYEETALSVQGVKRIDTMFIRTHGSYFIIDVKLSVDPTITVEAGHQIAKHVKVTLRQTYKEVEDVLVHINPF